MNSEIFNIKCGEIFSSKDLNFRIVCIYCDSFFYDFCNFTEHCLSSCSVENELTVEHFSKTDTIIGIKKEEKEELDLPYEGILEDKVEVTLKAEDTNDECSNIDIKIKLKGSSLEIEKSKFDRIARNKRKTRIKKIITTKNLKKRKKIEAHTDKNDQNSDSTRLYKCELCEKSYNLSKDLKVHFEVVHEKKKRHHCDQCNKSFYYKSWLGRHKHDEHDRISYKCEQCNKEFNTYNTLFFHRKKKHPENFIQCAKCKKSFITEINLKKHECVSEEQRKDNRKDFMCEICGKGVKCMFDFKVHLRTHTGEKPFKCNICDKSFTSKSYLKFHARVHTGEKPFECPYCGKFFRMQTVFKDHVRIHTGERPFKCEVCDKAFSSATNLRKHMQNVHKIIKKKIV